MILRCAMLGFSAHTRALCLDSSRVTKLIYSRGIHCWVVAFVTAHSQLISATNELPTRHEQKMRVQARCTKERCFCEILRLLALAVNVTDGIICYCILIIARNQPAVHIAHHNVRRRLLLPRISENSRAVCCDCKRGAACIDLYVL